MTARIEYAPGRLPLFWDRSVVFFANLLAMFYGNVGATEELEAIVGGVDTYGGRLCPLLNLLFCGSDNLLVLEHEPDEHLLGYFRDELGLQIPELAILPHSRYLSLAGDLRDARTRLHAQREADPVLERILNSPAGWIDGFVTDRILVEAAELLEKQTIISPEISRRGNNKLLLHRFLEQEGFPIFDTETAAHIDDVPAAIESLGGRGYRRVVAKSQVGASGIGMCKLDVTDPDLQRLSQHMFFEGPCMVQGWLDESVSGVHFIGSPSMQMFLDETTVNLFDVTDQILSADSVHEGNLSPPSFWDEFPEIGEAMRVQSAAVGQWLHDDGYRGTASGDFQVVQRAGRTEVRLCEVNARVTGATYPSVLARLFRPQGSWLMRNVRFDPAISSSEMLAALHDANQCFLPGDDGGVLPINFNTDHHGAIRKAQFLCLGSDERQCLEHLMASAAVLPVKWTYDRD